MNQNQYIVESCDIQGASSTLDYINMARAYQYAYDVILMARNVELFHLSALIQLVRGNITNYRCQPATFANGNMTSTNNRGSILRVLYALIGSQKQLGAVDFYHQLMILHPWDDGNGRVGSLLFNVLNKTIIDPIHPPDLFAPPPVEGYSNHAMG